MNVGAMYANSDIPDVGKAKHKKVFSRRHKGGITRIQCRTEAEEEAFKLGYGVQAVYWLLDGHQNWITLDYSAFALVTQHHLII
ncbi:hypothetical protein SeLEV6574_g04362 [Synchytrium endobioticum]|uniref:Uncharacterized protein n=1 Tax=Synchytrium endobioticum TaxID=286115 RepID=A0A507CZU2_9FUNG|nr:hypothetical protein SeLEV6574_g04362 [Synchytrium endobioticum]